MKNELITKINDYCTLYSSIEPLKSKANFYKFQIGGEDEHLGQFGRDMFISKENLKQLANFILKNIGE